MEWDNTAFRVNNNWALNVPRNAGVINISKLNAAECGPQTSFREIKVFRLDAMAYTPFAHDRRQAIESHGISLVNDLEAADVVVSRYATPVSTLRRFAHRLRGRKQRYLIWTDEPRFNTYLTGRRRGFGIIPDLHVMNCYTGDIYFNNYYHSGWAMKHPAKPLPSGPLLTNRKMVILTGYTPDREAVSFKIDGQEADLSWLRCYIARMGHNQGLIDVFGKNWPDGVALDESRQVAQWDDRKLDLLSCYRFNLCFENTIFPYYCTEKIWHSIGAGCLPVYYGAGTRIYEDFPRGSFLDYAELGSPDALFEKIQTMEEDEFRQRMNRCIEVYNRIYQSAPWKDTSRKVLENIINRLHGMTGHSHAAGV